MEDGGITLFTLLEWAWAAFAIFAWWVWQKFKEISGTLSARGVIVDEHEATQRVLEQRMKTVEKRQDEDRETHQAALTDFRSEVGEIKKELVLIRKDFGAGFKEVGDKIVAILTQNPK